MSNVHVSQSGTAVTILLEGEFDEANISEVLAAARDALARVDVTHIVVDLLQVTFMGSTGLGALVALHGDAERGSVDLTLRNVPSRILRLLELTALDGLFDLAPADATEVGEVASADEPRER